MKTQASLFEKTLEMARLRWSDFVFVGIFVVLILISSLISETFFTSRNLINISRQIVTNGLISLGMLIVILTGGVDLSVGSIVALCGIMATGLQKQIPMPLAILVALVVGIAVGIGERVLHCPVQAPAVHRDPGDNGRGARRDLRVSRKRRRHRPTRHSARSSAEASSAPCPPPPSSWSCSSSSSGSSSTGPFPGRAIVAIGGNEEAVRLAGINVRGHLLLAYMLSGLFAGIAGVLLASRLGIAQPSFGAGLRAGCHRRRGHRRRHPGRRRRRGHRHVLGSAHPRGDRQPAQPVQRPVLLPADHQGAHHPRGGPFAPEEMTRARAPASWESASPAGLWPGGPLSQILLPGGAKVPSLGCCNYLL